MGHDHAHGSGVQHRGRLAIVLALSLTVLVVEAVIAVMTGSLALLADAGHMLGDSFGLVMALAAITVAQRGGAPGSRRTFGYHRTEILAAGLNGLVLLGLAVWVTVSAIGRFGDAPELEGGLILVAGAVGLVVNVIGLALLRSGSQESLNVRGAYLEVLGDALGSVAVIASATIILLTDFYAADAIASLVIAAMILPRAVSLLKDVVEVLLESTPSDVDLVELRAHIVGTPGVKDVHDLHVWTITSGMPVMSAHVVVDDDVTGMVEAHAVLDRLRGCLAEHFDVEHSTFQIEPSGHLDSEHHVHH
ncbi:cation diffusion facilitator family transporter [Aeromicrobium stalagmiti]|uniref:cation diffusion facilitator family transporter n=1 Tax=Aeromicrobium stalagmiti TaxID=2738988 RepID=UPI00156873B0|nr:cation diffusion facilitator family transporter [Aeromicrobium stalagmiti]NRQ49692.1 cation transporter [Aeromicrobium stalagmiti]